MVAPESREVIMLQCQVSLGLMQSSHKGLTDGCVPPAKPLTLLGWRSYV